MARGQGDSPPVRGWALAAQLKARGCWSHQSHLMDGGASAAAPAAAGYVRSGALLTLMNPGLRICHQVAQPWRAALYLVHHRCGAPGALGARHPCLGRLEEHRASTRGTEPISARVRMGRGTDGARVVGTSHGFRMAWLGGSDGSPPPGVSVGRGTCTGGPVALQPPDLGETLGPYVIGVG
jgi:hypothetical protein